MKTSNIYSYQSPSPSSASYATYVTPKNAVSDETKQVQNLATDIKLINKQTDYIKENKMDFASLSKLDRVKLLDTY